MKREREDHKQMGQGAAGRLNEPPHSSSCHHDTAASSHDLPACFITTPPSVRGPHSPSQSRVSLPPHSQRAARLYARRHGDGHLHALTHSPLPPTPPAELRDDLARALAGGTRGHLGGGGGGRGRGGRGGPTKRPLQGKGMCACAHACGPAPATHRREHPEGRLPRLHDLALASAGGARLGRSARLGAAAVAHVARLQVGDLHLPLAPVDGLPELEGELDPGRWRSRGGRGEGGGGGGAKPSTYRLLTCCNEWLPSSQD